MRQVIFEAIEVKHGRKVEYIMHQYFKEDKKPRKTVKNIPRKQREWFGIDYDIDALLEFAKEIDDDIEKNYVSETVGNVIAFNHRGNFEKEDYNNNIGSRDEIRGDSDEETVNDSDEEFINNNPESSDDSGSSADENSDYDTDESEVKPTRKRKRVC